MYCSSFTYDFTVNFYLIHRINIDEIKNSKLQIFTSHANYITASYLKSKRRRLVQHRPSAQTTRWHNTIRWEGMERVKVVSSTDCATTTFATSTDSLSDSLDTLTTAVPPPLSPRSAPLFLSPRVRVRV